MFDVRLLLIKINFLVATFLTLPYILIPISFLISEHSLYFLGCNMSESHQASSSEEQAPEPVPLSPSSTPDESARREADNNHNTTNPPSNNEPSSSARSDQKDPNKLVKELMYSFASFHAIVSPVFITMLLSALAVVYINDEETLAAGQASLSNTYEVVDLDEGNSSQNLGASVVNALIIVGVVCGMTFVVVLLYKYRCMKFLMGYMVFATTMLLGFMTGRMWNIAIDIYEWSIDKFSFYFVLYNFAVVGCLAIFYGKGIPMLVSQGYLIASSVVLAWQLSYFSEWTAWTLLVLLACYDLFAVLTPCGPLKALVKQMQKPGAPPMPGLLYEAQLPSNVRRPAGPRTNNTQQQQEESTSTPSNQGTDNATESDTQPSIGQEDQRHESSAPQNSGAAAGETSSEAAPAATGNTNTSTPSTDPSSEEKKSNGIESTNASSSVTASRAPDDSVEVAAPSTIVESSAQVAPADDTVNDDVEDQPTGKIPLALAKTYKLRVIDEENVLGGNPIDQEAPKIYTPEEIRQGEWTPKQLASLVTALFPPGGGRIELKEPEESDDDDRHTYLVYNRTNEVVRKFVVNENGEVFQVVKKNSEDDTDNTIKLGLGDFIFYSLLVSKAAMYSFTTFAACVVVILAGLGATLILLSVYGKALPALPISIFMAVIFYLLTRVVIEPWIHEVFQLPVYV